MAEKPPITSDDHCMGIKSIIGRVGCKVSFSWKRTVALEVSDQGLVTRQSEAGGGLQMVTRGSRGRIRESC